MINRLLPLLLLLSVLLFGKTIQEQVSSLEKQIPTASKAQTVTILHDLENLYISAVIEGDKKQIVRILKDMIACQKALGLDSSAYERELAELLPPPKQIHTKPSKSGKMTQSPSTKPGRIRSIALKDHTLILKFDHPITTKAIHHFQIPTPTSYKDVYDLETNLYFTPPTLSIPGIEKIKIAQNRKNRVRIVLQNSSRFTSDMFIRQGTLFIRINTPARPLVYAPPPAKFQPKKSVPLKRTKKERKRSPTTATSSAAVYASSKTIVIDPGHGGKDPGAVGYKRYQEKKAVLAIAKKLKTILKKRGYRVYLTRERDTFIKLRDRTHFANEKNADLFISIHANAAPKKKRLSMRGIETFFLSPAKTEKAKRIAAIENREAGMLGALSKDTLLSFLNRNKIVQSNKLAIDIQGGILSYLKKKYEGIVDGGVREAPFWVLVGAQMPAVLIEVGYITNPKEADRLFNPFYQKRFAEGIARGIDNYFLKNR